MSLEEPRWSCANSYQRGNFATIISGHKQQSIRHAKKKYRQERWSFGENKDAVRATSKKFVTVGDRGGSEVEGRLGTPCVPFGKTKKSLGWRELASALREGNPKCPKPLRKLVHLESFGRSSALTPYSRSSLLSCILEAPQNEKLDILALQPLTHSLICFEHIKLIQHIRL